MSHLVLRSKSLVVCVLGLLCLSAFVSSVSSSDDQPRRAAILQDWDDPVAVIGALPDTAYVDSDILLNGSGSTDDSGAIVDYAWEITCWDEVDTVYGEQVVYTLAVPGLNMIKLTVTDSVGKTGINVTAVMCVRLDGTSYPIAVIEPLPPVVSNGTRQSLNGSGYDSSGGSLSIESFLWEITNVNSNTTELLEGGQYPYKFSELGLYTIKLTVTDFDGNIGQDFAAVVAVLDSDGDEIPDWWEELNFGNLEDGRSDDPDGDGYMNLEEYVAGTDPMVSDPPPKGLLENYWMYVAAVAGATVAVVLAMLPGMKRRRKEAEKKKIEYAIEIEKELDREK